MGERGDRVRRYLKGEGNRPPDARDLLFFVISSSATRHLLEIYGDIPFAPALGTGFAVGMVGMAVLRRYRYRQRRGPSEVGAPSEPIDA